MIPGDGGRRSRRGFAYQDAVSLLACLDMHEGKYIQVSWENLEDVQCETPTGPLYKQVKTQEGGQERYSIAKVCKAEKVGNPHSSILGKLFTGKPLTEGTRFSLVMNEVPQKNLLCFTKDSPPCENRPAEKKEIASKLSGLKLPDGRGIDWCIDRFEVEVRPRSIDDIEAVAKSALEPYVKEVLKQTPLTTELEDILIALLGRIERDARKPVVTVWSENDFAEVLKSCVRKVSRVSETGELEPLESLSSKLRPTGVTAEEASRMADMMTRYRRKYRSSVGQTHEDYDTLADEIYAICTEVSAQRRIGLVAPGAEAYNTTLARVREISAVANGAVSPATAYAVLSDITARCQNRYADAS
ncbi:hypothetical protein ALI22I_38065 [Saccharothrix sp. ALI-22-I]|nr:hypothetical protein ALI22I_38065 [Saccharothrix sp. ALI-22-I]